MFQLPLLCIITMHKIRRRPLLFIFLEGLAKSVVLSWVFNIHQWALLSTGFLDLPPRI